MDDSNGLGLQIIEMKPNLSANDGINKKSSDDNLSGFSIGMEVTVLLKNSLRTGRVTHVSMEDGIKIKYENGDEEEYIPKILQKMVEKAEERRVRLVQSSTGETKEAIKADDFAMASAYDWLMADPDLKIKSDLSATLTTLHLRTAFDFERITDEGFDALGKAMKKPEARRWKKIGREKIKGIRKQYAKEKQETEDDYHAEMNQVSVVASKAKFVAEFAELLPALAGKWIKEEGYMDESMEELKELDSMEMEALVATAGSSKKDADTIRAAFRGIVCPHDGEYVSSNGPHEGNFEMMESSHIGAVENVLGPHLGTTKEKIGPHLGLLVPAGHTGELEDHNATSLWVPDDDASTCAKCRSEFSWFKRKHHCRCCGQIFCDDCSSARIMVHPGHRANKPGGSAEDEKALLRVCSGCLNKKQIIKNPPAKKWSCCNAVEGSSECKENLVTRWSCCNAASSSGISTCSANKSNVWSCCDVVVGGENECKNNPQQMWSCCKNLNANSDVCRYKGWKCCSNRNRENRSCEENVKFTWSCCNSQDKEATYCVVSGLRQMLHAVGMSSEEISDVVERVGKIEAVGLASNDGKITDKQVALAAVANAGTWKYVSDEFKKEFNKDKVSFFFFFLGRRQQHS